jgi:hypothetical protein
MVSIGSLEDSMRLVSFVVFAAFFEGGEESGVNVVFPDGEIVQLTWWIGTVESDYFDGEKYATDFNFIFGRRRSRDD